MTKLVAIAVFCAAATTLASAGEVLGKITTAGASVGEGTEVAAKCGGKSYPAVKTDKTGSYHLVIAETGKCTLTVTYKGQTADIDVASYDDAAQADLVLEAKDGKLTARRK
ncbi:MAG TPA: FctA domain-containing protein [Candidatus Bathyarchaeia archaeon]|nr:FctA domain-containing protein [Candidatus Bathyarchaeia archaeon]